MRAIRLPKSSETNEFKEKSSSSFSFRPPRKRQARQSVLSSERLTTGRTRQWWKRAQISKRPTSFVRLHASGLSDPCEQTGVENFLQHGRKNSGEIEKDKSYENKITLLMFGSALVLAVLSGSSALAGTLLVDDDNAECPDAGFTSIQTAVDAAASGDVIQVCPGTYDEQVEIAKPLTLVGVKRGGKNAAVVQPSNMIANTEIFGYPTASAMLVRDTSDVTIRNITIDGINNGIVCDATTPFIDGIFYKSASGLVDRVVVRNFTSPEGCAYGDAIDVIRSEEAAAQLTISDSSLHDYDSAGILQFGSGRLHATRNVITGRGPSTIGEVGIQLNDGASGLIEDNVVTNHLYAPCPNPEDCLFISNNIGVFATGKVTIVGNTVGKSNVGIFAGAYGSIAANGVSVLANRVFDAELYHGDGIFVGQGENNLVKDNVITNCGHAGVFVAGVNNTIRNNTINEAAFGLSAITGNNILQNWLFNTLVTKEVFVAGAPSPDRPIFPSEAVMARPVLRNMHR